MSGVMKTCVIKFIRKGTGISRTETEYAQNQSNTTAPTSGWNVNPPTWQNGYYIWQRIKFIYTDNSYFYSNAVCISGGNGISSVTEHYLATSASSGVTKNTSGWTTTVQAVTSTKKYLWNYETTTYTDGSTVDTTPVIIGVYGEKGDTGVSISSVTEYYLATSSSSGVTRNTSGWTTSIQTITATKKYLWNYEKITYTNNTTSYTDPVIIGVYGDKGDKGDTGDTGDQGPQGDKGDKGDKGNTGDSAPVAFATPDKIVFPCGNGGAVKTATTKSVIFSLKVGTNTATVTSVTSGTKPTGITVTGQADNAVTITASTSATASGMASGVTFTVNGTYGGKSYSATITVALIGSIEGSKGYTGPSLRVQDWNKCTTNGTVNYQFYQGADGEKYKDVVLYNGYYYSCILTHKDKSVTPSNQTFWQLGDKVELIATNILLANYSLIKNLGAEAIQMYAPGHQGDANYLLFQAKDGSVTCNTGNFYNVNVTGTVKAKLFYSPTKQLTVENFTNRVYTINPASDPAHTFVLDHPLSGSGDDLTINLPNATTYDGLELQFLEIRRTRSLISGVILSGSITNGGTLFADISSGYLKLNNFIVLKAMAGRWYAIQGELST